MIRVVRKHFSNQLFQDNDEVAKQAVEHLKEHFHVDEFKDSATRYMVDREGWADGEHIVNVEVEVKHNWKKGMNPFPYNTIHLPQRKEKYLSLEKPTHFVIFSSDLQGAITFADTTVLEHGNLKEVPNKFVARGELFYNVPISQTQWLKIGDGNGA